MPFPIDAKWITQTEEKLGVKLPPSFVTAMSKMNGGTVRTKIDHFELFPFFDASDRKDWYGFPPDAVAIGANGGGDLLVLIPMSDHPDTLQHSVYWWDHETGAIELVAEDFSDLQKT